MCNMMCDVGLISSGCGSNTFMKSLQKNMFIKCYYITVQRINPVCLSQKQMFQDRSGRMIQAFSPRGSPSSSPPRDFSPSRSPSPPSRWAMPRTSPPSSPKGASASISSMSEGDEDEK